MADFKLFDRGLNYNPSLTKRIAFGDSGSEENMTFEQLISMMKYQLFSNTIWYQLGLNGSWQPYSIGGMASGIRYRKNKIGQLEMHISVKYPEVAYDSNLATLPDGFRPYYSSVIQTQLSKDINGHGPCWLNIGTDGSISINRLDDTYNPPFFFAQSVIIPLTFNE